MASPALQKLFNRLAEFRTRNLLKNFNLLIGISKAVCAEMSGEVLSNLYCLDPGVTLDGEDLNLIERINVSVKDKKAQVVFGGRPDASKGVVEALYVFRELLKQHPNIKLYITGLYITGKLTNKTRLLLNKVCKKLGVDGKVIMTGFISREERLKIVKESKLMLYPSHVDTFSYAVAESLLLGTPVVAYDIPAIRINT